MAAGDIPPQLGEQTVWAASFPPRQRLIDVFVWGKVLETLWRPVRVASIAALMQYQGNPAWLAWKGGTGMVTNRSIGANRLELELEVPKAAPAAGLRLVIHDAWWPGWRATLDGRVVAIETEGLWRAVMVPPGRHTLALAYRPAGIRNSLIILAGGVALLGLIAALTGWVGWRAGRRRRMADAVPSETGGAPAA
jgi:hypothetical protein